MLSNVHQMFSADRQLFLTDLQLLSIGLQLFSTFLQILSTVLQVLSTVLHTLQVNFLNQIFMELEPVCNSFTFKLLFNFNSIFTCCGLLNYFDPILHSFLFNL